MDYITTTGLRTKSSQLIQSLEKGMEVPLIHRSQVVGIIKPKKATKPLTKKDIYSLKKLAKEINLPKLSYRKRENIYRKNLLQKYGEDIS